MLDAVAGKLTVQDLGQGFGHQVLIAMCMVVVSASPDRLRGLRGHTSRDSTHGRHRLSEPKLIAYLPRLSKGFSILPFDYILGIDPM